MVVLRRQFPTLDAGVPAKHRIVAIAADLDDFSVRDFHVDRATRVAESAKGFVGADLASALGCGHDRRS